MKLLDDSGKLRDVVDAGQRNFSRAALVSGKLGRSVPDERH